MNYLTPETAKELCILVHAGQWRIPETVQTDSWDCYKNKEHFIHENGNKIAWCNGDKFLVYEPYHTHPIAVADMLDTDDEKIVAYLHDVIEDTLTDIIKVETHYYIVFENVYYPIKQNVYHALNCMSKIKGESYSQYINDLASNKLATKVKIADMFHNMSTSSSDKQKAKYIKYMPILLKSLK